jgi:hypothetical protein
MPSRVYPAVGPPAAPTPAGSDGMESLRILERMPRWPLVAALVLLVLLGTSQVLIPPLVENRIESRLTEGGGTANVSVSAFPAARLLFGDGKRISVTGTGLRLPLPHPGGGVLDKLDGFDRVDVSFTDLQAGPFAVSGFSLTRAASSDSYHLVASARTTPGDLTEYGASRLGLPGEPLLRFFAGQTLGNRPIPVQADMDLISDGGRVVVVSGEGTVAGYPTGPLAELITSAIVVRL